MKKRKSWVPISANLKCKSDMLRAQLISEYHQLQQVKGTDLYAEFEKTRKKVRTEKKKLYKVQG